MKYFDSKGREIEGIETEYIHGEGASVLGATYVDDGSDVPDNELDKLAESYQSELSQNGCERMMSSAYDRSKDARKYGN